MPIVPLPVPATSPPFWMADESNPKPPDESGSGWVKVKLLMVVVASCDMSDTVRLVIDVVAKVDMSDTANSVTVVVAKLDAPTTLKDPSVVEPKTSIVPATVKVELGVLVPIPNRVVDAL